MLANRQAFTLRPVNSPTPRQCGDCQARHVGLCDVLSDTDLSVLALVAQRITVPAGKVFIEEGETASHFYDVNLGDVRVFKSLSDGRRQITGFMGVGHFLGVSAGGKYAFTAEAMNEVHVCRFDRAAIKGVFDRFPALERRLLDVATHELVIAQEQMLLLGRKSAVERVASFLLAWSERAEFCRTVHLPMSRTDLADYLGLTIETVSRSLSQLKRDSLIAFTDAHFVTLLKPMRLRQMDGGEG